MELPVSLWGLSYTSIATAPDDIVEADVREICALAGPHNEQVGITGALTLRNGRFAQVLEGPLEALRALMERVIADPRHHSVQIITDGPIMARRYAEWSMAYREPKDFIRDQIDVLIADAKLMSEALSNLKH